MNTEEELIALNKGSVEVEQAGGKRAHAFFEPLLSKQLMFRRANGVVVGKDDFLKGLEMPSPFSSREPGQISVATLNGRALVTLDVDAKRVDDGLVHHYRNIRLFFPSGKDWVMELWYNYEIAGL